MRRYFKVFGENMYSEEGYAYYEFTDQLCTRQLDEVHGELIKVTHPSRNICDQPLSVIPFEPEEEITDHEFEAVWVKAKAETQ